MYLDPSGSQVAWNDRASKSPASKMERRRASVSAGTWQIAGAGKSVAMARMPTSQRLRRIRVAVISLSVMIASARCHPSPGRQSGIARNMY